MDYEYKDFTITVDKGGEGIMEQLDRYRTGFEDEGWEYMGIATCPTSDENVVDMVYSFRRIKPA